VIKITFLMLREKMRKAEKMVLVSLFPVIIQTILLIIFLFGRTFSMFSILLIIFVVIGIISIIMIFNLHSLLSSGSYLSFMSMCLVTIPFAFISGMVISGVMLISAYRFVKMGLGKNR